MNSNFYEKHGISDISKYNYPMCMSRNVPLQCSTRGIGFGVVSTLCSVEAVYKSPPPQDVPVFQLYRVSLALLESKMSLVNIYSSKDVYSFRNYSYRDAVLSIDKMPTSISTIIDSLGTFTHSNTTFVPVMAPDRFDNNNLLIPDAGSVYYSNLRSVVSSLSNSRTPFEARKRFVQENSIPGARFSAECILENPDDIMPDGYDNNQLLCEDIKRVRVFLGRCKKYADWIHPHPLLESGKGKPCCAVATERSLSIPSASDFATLQRIGITGKNEQITVYSPIKLNPRQWLLGTANFLREPPKCIPGLPDTRYPFWDGCSESRARSFSVERPSTCIYSGYKMLC